MSRASRPKHNSGAHRQTPYQLYAPASLRRKDTRCSDDGAREYRTSSSLRRSLLAELADDRLMERYTETLQSQRDLLTWIKGREPYLGHDPPLMLRRLHTRWTKLYGRLAAPYHPDWETVESMGPEAKEQAVKCYENWYYVR